MIDQNYEIPLTPGAQAGCITVDCIEVNQPIGVFYVAAIHYEELIAISRVDTREIEKESLRRDGFETLLGIQRKLDKNREKELMQYVNTYAFQRL
jgi:hypothetical protein